MKKLIIIVCGALLASMTLFAGSLQDAGFIYANFEVGGYYNGSGWATRFGGLTVGNYPAVGVNNYTYLYQNMGASSPPAMSYQYPQASTVAVQYNGVPITAYAYTGSAGYLDLALLTPTGIKYYINNNAGVISTNMQTGTILPVGTTITFTAYTQGPSGATAQLGVITEGCFSTPTLPAAPPPAPAPPAPPAPPPIGSLQDAGFLYANFEVSGYYNGYGWATRFGGLTAGTYPIVSANNYTYLGQSMNAVGPPAMSFKYTQLSTAPVQYNGTPFTAYIVPGSIGYFDLTLATPAGAQYFIDNNAGVITTNIPVGTILPVGTSITFSAFTAGPNGAIAMLGVITEGCFFKTTYPTWWYSGAIPGTSITSYAGSLAPNNYATINLGQLKWVATRAKAYLDAELASVGGSQIDLTTVFPVMPAPTDPAYAAAVATNYSPANLGQLKVISTLFYNRLNQVGFNLFSYLQTQGYPATWVTPSPWPLLGVTGSNYAPANLGQLKLVFGFDLSNFTPKSSLSTLGDGIPDWWKLQYGLSLSNSIANLDSSGDGLSNFQKYQLGLSPSVADNGAVRNTPQVHAYTYDALGRLTSASDGTIEVFTYDAEGNLLTSTGR